MGNGVFSFLAPCGLWIVCGLCGIGLLANPIFLPGACYLQGGELEWNFLRVRRSFPRALQFG